MKNVDGPRETRRKLKEHNRVIKKNTEEIWEKKKAQRNKKEKTSKKRNKKENIVKPMIDLILDKVFA